MSTGGWGTVLPRPIGGAHPVVLGRRLRGFALLAASALIPLALALAIAVATPQPNPLLLAALAAGGVGVVALIAVPRYEITVLFVALYLGLLDGPVKLGSGGHTTAASVRDVLIGAVCIGGLLRIAQRGNRVVLPPLAVWPLAWIALVVVEAFNPQTAGLTKVLGGFRQELEWVPFFFFGYTIVRSRERFRRLFIVLGVLALVNGAVSTYQTRIGSAGLASWGPGYHELVYGGSGLTGRTYSTGEGGEGKVRPPALGADSGFGGGLGVVALTGTFALLTTGTLRRRWPALVLCLGAMIAIGTGLGRLQLTGGVLALFAFTALAFTAGRRVSRPLAVLLGVAVLAVPLGVLFVSLEGEGTFSRYTKFSSGGGAKTRTLEHIPTLIAGAPFGVGLATGGAAAGFGGKQKEVFEGRGVSSETQYNLVVDELGLPGLLLWVGLAIRLGMLVLPRIRRIRDDELRTHLSALMATLMAFTFIGLFGPTMTSASFGPFFWLSAGVLAYWFAGPGRRELFGARELAPSAHGLAPGALGAAA